MFLTGVRCPRPPNWPYLVNFRCFGGLKKRKCLKKLNVPKKHPFTTQYVQKIASCSFVQVNPKTCPLCSGAEK